MQGIAELITRPGLINVDFADVRTVMSETGMAMMGSGAATRRGSRARGRRGRDLEPAARGHQPRRARTASWSTSPPAWTCRIGEFHEVGDIVKQFASDDATVVVGTVIDPEMTDQIRVTVVATGLGRAVAAVPRPCRRASQRDGRARRRRDAASGRRSATTAADYDTPAKPAAQRQRAVGDGLRARRRAARIVLDIPAFLRRQAD